MKSYSRTHLADGVLLAQSDRHLAQNHESSAELLADWAEIDARKLYLPHAYPSMYAFCIARYHFPEDATYKRIQAARVAREHPAIFPALAEGRLHLSAVLLLAPHLKPDTANDLIAAATHKSKAEITEMLARRMATEAAAAGTVFASPAGATSAQLAPGRVADAVSQSLTQPLKPVALLDASFVPPAIATPAAPPVPLRFDLRVSLDQETRDLLRRAQELLSHAVPDGNVPELLKRALRLLVADAERRRFAAASRPRKRRGSSRERYIPAEVKRAVWKRDQGRCTFVSDAGQRCESRKFLEFDHADPVARGGHASVASIRLRCRAHNQYEAERVFGMGFMQAKRDAARARAEGARSDRPTFP